MPSPTSALATLRPDLAGSVMEFNLAADRGGFIGTQVAPVLEVQSQAGKFGKIPLEQLLKDRETSRSPGAKYNRDTMKFESASYATEEHGIEEPVDDREARMYAEYFDAELLAAGRAIDTVMRNHEKRVASLLTNATTFSGQTTVISTAWSTTASATPIDDIEQAVLEVYNRCGLWPNAVVMSRKAFRQVRHVQEVIDRIESSGAGAPSSAGMITAQQLAEVFNLDRVIVAGGTKNTANEGANASISQIWGDGNVQVCRVASTNDVREPCIARTFHWSEDGSQIGTTLETYRDETARSEIVRARMDTDELLILKECGQLLTGAL